MKKITIFTFFVLLLPAAASSQAKLVEVVAKRIADATPKSLPQTPSAPKLRSDAEDQYLRGRVMTVIEENEYLGADSSYPGRHYKSITDFDERGNRVKAVYFSDNGNPYEVSVFGYVDGTRASSYRMIYEDSGVFTGGSPSNEVLKEKHASDLRYSYKYEYRYVSGKLAEMNIFLNNGEKGMRYVYDYNGNQMEEVVYGYDGTLNQKYITVFDSKGYEVEWRDIAVINLPRLDRKFLIKMEAFDKEGNWIKRTFLKATTEDGKEKLAPERIEYRTISYYPKTKASKSN